MEKPSFIRDFSKENSQEERNKAAQEIRSARAKGRLDKEEKAERSEEMEALRTKLQELRGEIEGFDSLWSKARDYLRYRALQSELAEGEQKEEELIETNESVVPPQYEEPKKLLDRFYGDQVRKWEQAPYSKEDTEQYFSEENLSSLSVEEYTLLLKRFPSEMMTHVTRQGVRDHLGPVEHFAGFGEYHNGFGNIMSGDRRLHNQLTLLLEQDQKENAINGLIGTKTYDSSKEAMENLNQMLSPDHASQLQPGSYADFTAVHAAAEEVADAYYGAEKGNEIFFTFPSAMIASQYHFSGQLNKSGGGYHNDQWIWASEEKGIPIDAGLVFIPESASVDRKNGSRYELDENQKPMENKEYMDTLQSLLGDESKMAVIREVAQTLGGLRSSARKILEGEGINEDEKGRRIELVELKKKLSESTGIQEEELLDALLDYQNANSLLVMASGEKNPIKQKGRIAGMLQGEGLLFVKAKDTIPSKQYWEDYFAQHPDQKPSKLFYYPEGDPTKAFLNWKRKNGLIKKSESGNMGFSEHQIDLREADDAKKALQTTAQFGDRFKNIAQQAIENYFEYDKRGLAA